MEINAVAVDEDGLGGDGEFCTHGNLIEEEFCQECADALWELSDEIDRAINSTGAHNVPE